MPGTSTGRTRRARQCLSSVLLALIQRAILWLLPLTLLLPLSCSGEPTPLPPATAVPARTAAAAPSPTPGGATPTALPQHSPTPRATASPTPTPVGEPLLRRTCYALSVELDYARHHLAVTQAITYLNRYEPLDELLLVVEPNRRPGVFDLHSLRWADGRSVERYRLEGARLHIPLDEPLPSGDAVGLSLSFDLDLPGQPGPFGYTARQANLGDWYPFVPPRRLVAQVPRWIANEPAAVGEHLAYDVADYVVDISLLDAPLGLVVAASDPAAHGGAASRYRLENARGFAWSAGEYVVLQETVGEAAVRGYVFPGHVEAGKAVVKTTAAALALYADLYAPYPHDCLTVVEADFADGMEYEGLYFLGQGYYATYGGDPKGYLTAIAAHETAHQWWYGLVGNDQAAEPWLDESLATYSELLFYERIYPDLVDWWWGFRVERLQPAGWVNSTIYDHTGFRSYVDAVYLRGAQFLHALRERIGEEAFFAFLQDYAEQGAGRQASAGDFFQVLPEHTSEDVSDLAKAYFR